MTGRRKSTYERQPWQVAGWLSVGMCWLGMIAWASGQERKPPRARAPEFRPGQFDGVFFGDVRSVLQGELPSTRAAVQLANQPTATPVEQSASPGDGDPLAWHQLISPTSLEDLIKGSKLRLDKVVTTPAAFAGGGFQEARKEFSLQALLFAIIEQYPGEVRWQASSGVARESLARSAANAKVGSRQVYDEAKKRLLDLGDLLNGSQLAGDVKTEVDWSKLIDRVPLMQLLDWAQQDYLSTLTANQTQFSENRDAIRRYAELISVLGKASLQPEMPDASDDDFVALAHDMIAQAQQIVQAVETNNAEAARQASGKLGQSCTNCHDNFK